MEKDFYRLQGPPLPGAAAAYAGAAEEGGAHPQPGQTAIGKERESIQTNTSRSLYAIHEVKVNSPLISKLRSLVSTLGAQSISIGTGPDQAILTCIPACGEALGDVLGLTNQVLGPDFLTVGRLKVAQILWAGSQGVGRLTCTQELGWTQTEFIPSRFDPVLSLILTGVEDKDTWIYAFDAETVYLNGNRVGNGLPFSIGDHHGQVIHDESFERLTCQ